MSSLITAFVVTGTASSIAILSLGEDGSALNWAEARTWVLYFFMLGLSIAALSGLVLAVIDGRDLLEGWRGRMTRWAPLTGWLITGLAGSTTRVLSDRALLGLFFVWAGAIPLCVVLPLVLGLFNVSDPRNLLMRVLNAQRYLIVAFGVVLCTCAPVLCGVALGVAYVRATT